MTRAGPFHGFDLELDQDVYAPAEDSALLLRALDLAPPTPGARACDVGTGTGIAALHLARRGARVVAVDVNPRAVRLARANAARNRLDLAVVRGDLLDALRGPLDLVAFNPPYLPVEGEVPGDLAKAWEGGAGGIAWAPRFLDGLRRTLAPRGQAVVLLSSLGAPEEFRALANRRGFTAEAVASEKLPWETLEAVRVQRANL